MKMWEEKGILFRTQRRKQVKRLSLRHRKVNTKQRDEQIMEKCKMREETEIQNHWETSIESIANQTITTKKEPVPDATQWVLVRIATRFDAEKVICQFTWWRPGRTELGHLAASPPYSLLRSQHTPRI